MLFLSSDFRVNQKLRNFLISCGWYFGVGSFAAYLILSYSAVNEVLPNSVPGSFPDAYFFLWNIAHINRFLSGDTALYFSTEIFHPYGASLALHTLVEGCFVPLALVAGQSLSIFDLYKLGVLVLVVLNALSTLYFLNALSENRIVNALLCLGLSFHPYFISHLDAGHLNLLFFFPLPLALGAVVGIAKVGQRSFSRVLVLAMAIGILPYGSLYYCYYLGMFMTISIFLSALLRRWQAVVELSGGTFFGLVIGFPKLWMVIQSVLSRAFTPDHDPIKHSADLISYFVPGRYQQLGEYRWFSSWAGTQALHAGETSLYLGCSLIFMLLIGMRLCSNSNDRRMAATLVCLAVLFGVLSLGPVFHFMGMEVADNTAVGLISRTLFFPSVPARFGIVTVTLLFGAIAILFSARSRAGTSICVALIVLLVAEYWPVPVKQLAIPGEQELVHLKEGPVMDFGTPEEVMGRQALHGHSVVGGMLARRPKEVLRSYKRNDFIRLAENQRSSTPDLIRRDLDALEVSQIIVPVASTGLINALSQIDGIYEIFAGKEIRIYAVEPRVQHAQ